MQVSTPRSWISLAEAGAWLALVLAAFIYTFQFDDPLPVYEWGPAHWPRVVLLGMLMAGVWLLYLDWRMLSMPSSVEVKESVDDDISSLKRSTQIKIVLIFLLPLFYTFLIHKMGFLLITPFFLFAYMWLMGVERLRTLITVTVCVYAALVLVFVKLIFTYLPPGAGVFNAINGHILGFLS